MILQHLNIVNYKNILEAQLDFSPKVNCLIGNNGMGKTNVLDAVFFMSFCRSHLNQTDASVINHQADFMMMQGRYLRRGVQEDISLAMQRGKRKVVRRGGKAYQRLSEHIGLLPLVMTSPNDWNLIGGSGEERRKFMNQVISQSDTSYLAALIQYRKALEQRNSMLRQEISDPLLYESVEQQLTTAAAVISKARRQWIEDFTPIFMRYYSDIAGPDERVGLRYQSHLNGATMPQLLAASRQRDMALGHTTCGVHRDDLELMLGDYPMRHTGSQGQGKTYTLALRLAQFSFLKQNTATTPILLFDDIFDKLDATRVESIVEVVSRSGDFGQIFITDTNRTHLDSIIERIGGEHAMFAVSDGHCVPVTPWRGGQE